jgi:GDPmannose 4,6-dehydratase
MKTALICGISGQDGCYLAKLLLEKGYRVVGSTRNAHHHGSSNLEYLGIAKDVEIVSMAGNDFRSVLQALVRASPDEVYNLAGQSSVSLSFEQPVETLESISSGTLNLLEGIRFLNPKIRFYNAGSSDCFGNTGATPANEKTPFRPLSPYAVAKACATNMVATYREAYSLYACTGILFNHESPLRPTQFVTRKIVAGAYAIASRAETQLKLGNIHIARDWGWAPEYVEAMWLMLQREAASDFVIATGRTTTLEYFVQCAFAHFGLDWKHHVSVNPSLMRPSDIAYIAADASRAKADLGWSARTSMEDVVTKMCEHEVARAKG